VGANSFRPPFKNFQPKDRSSKSGLFSYKKYIAAGDTIIPHSSLLIPHSTNDEIYKKLIKFFDK